MTWTPVPRRRQTADQEEIAQSRYLGRYPAAADKKSNNHEPMFWRGRGRRLETHCRKPQGNEHVIHVRRCHDLPRTWPFSSRDNLKVAGGAKARPVPAIQNGQVGVRMYLFALSYSGTYQPNTSSQPILPEDC